MERQLSTDTIRQLQSDPRIRARCPYCQKAFPLRRGVLFYADGPIPGTARPAVEARRQTLQEGHTELRELRARLRRSEHLSIDVNLAYVLERVVPTLDGFGPRHRDCRPLSDPIDYIAFNGLTRSSHVDSLTFIDVKTGDPRLNPHQRMIRDAVTAGRVVFKLYGQEGERG